MLFKRLGWTWYRPIGMDWFTHGYFKIAEPYGNSPVTIGQYLDINDLPYEPYTNLNEIVDNKNGIFHSYDGENKITHNAITYEMFKKMKFDYIIATHPAHGNWEELLQFQPGAKFVMQLGNEGQDTMAKNVLSSVWAYTPKLGQNILYYHQEFSLKDFRYEPLTSHTLIRSFVHLLPEKGYFDIYKSILKEFTMEAYGMGTELGVSMDLPTQMRESAFGWHIKPADGYGHVIHNWFAVGRPIITRGNYYAGKTGGLLLKDGFNCIDLDKHTFEENVRMIRYWSLPDHHNEMCKNAHDTFKEIVDFDREAESIQRFLSNTV
jgi:hypothetical protein